MKCINYIAFILSQFYYMFNGKTTPNSGKNHSFRKQPLASKIEKSKKRSSIHQVDQARGRS